MPLHLIAILIMALPSFAQLKGGFRKTSKSVSWNRQKIKGADPKTFEASCPRDFMDRRGEAVFCAADAKQIYLGWNRGKEGTEIQALPRTPLKALGRNHFQLDKIVYFRSFAQPLHAADFATFNELDEETESGIDSRREWASDHRDVYCQGRKIEGISPKDLRFWPFLTMDCKDLEPAPGAVLPSAGYIRDAAGVFVFVDCKLHKKVPDADPATFNVPDTLFPTRARDGKGHHYNCGNLIPKRRRR